MKTATARLTQFLIFTLLMMGTFFVLEVKSQSAGEPDVNWISYAEATERVEAEEKKIMIFLEADWCTVCKRMHQEVFPDDDVASLINSDFYAVRVDIESADIIPVKGEMMSKKEYSKSVGIYGTPTILFLNSDEEIIGNFVGYSDKTDMTILLNFINSDAYMKESLESFSESDN